MPSPNQNQFYIAGAGDIGLRVLRRLLQSGRCPGLEPAHCICETRSSQKHSMYLSMGLRVQTAGDSSDIAADNLLVSFPPSTDYVSQVKRALGRWNRQGKAVLVSSTTVYQESSGDWVNEESPLRDGPIPEAEALFLKAGGHVVRLAGLYDSMRGPHVFWQAKPEIETDGNGWVNLIHRSDAAHFIGELLMHSQDFDPRVWHLSDGTPLKRKQIAEIWAEFQEVEAPKFLAIEGDLGKRVDSKKSRDRLGWVPRFSSFGEFVQSLIVPRNVLGSPLKSCCERPMTGFYRDGYCRVGEDDHGVHSVCVEITPEFLEFSKSAGNDLSTPRAEFGFPGLKSRDKWCLCASRWVEAVASGRAPRVYLESTSEKTLEFIEIEVLKKYALDLA